MKPYDFKMFKKVLFEIQSGVKVYLNDECLNSISYTAQDKFNQSVIGDIVSIFNVAGTKRFKRTVSSWREINSSGKFLD